MQKNYSVSTSRRILPALIAALSMTVIIGLAILAFGLNALLNQNLSVAQAASQPDTEVATDLTTIQDLQAIMSQYQVRETQYQSELQQAAEQINEISQQNLQYQQLFQALQNAGLIQLTSDGRVFISRNAELPSGFGDQD
jgi:uncharacterized protein HemX